MAGSAKEGRQTGAGADARARLLAAALSLFTRKGYAAATVREIVAEAGVTKPVLYYYFESKEGLFLDLMREPLARFEALLAESATGRGSAEGRIRAMCLRAYLLFRENVGHARLMYSIYYGPPQGAPFVDFDRLHENFRGGVEALLREGSAGGEFRRDGLPAMLWSLVGAVNVAMEVELCHPELSLGPEGLSAVLDVIFRGLAPERAAAPARKGSKG